MYKSMCVSCGTLTPADECPQLGYYHPKIREWCSSLCKTCWNRGIRFTDPPSFNDSHPAPVINGLSPGDEGYIQAWCDKNNVRYEKAEER